MNRIGMWLAGWIGAVFALTLGATDMYVAPEALGTGDGYTENNAAVWTDKLFWTHAQQRVKQQDTTVHFAAGTYVASKNSSGTVCLQLSKLGVSNHTLTLLGAENSGSVFLRDPSDSTEQTTENRLAYILYLYQCQNVVVDNLHFTGIGALGYALSIRTPYNVLVRNCSWTGMTGIYYGATGSSTGGSGAATGRVSVNAGEGYLPLPATDIFVLGGKSGPVKVAGGPGLRVITGSGVVTLGSGAPASFKPLRRAETAALVSSFREESTRNALRMQSLVTGAYSGSAWGRAS